MSDGYRFFLHPEAIAYGESLGADMSCFTPMAKLPPFSDAPLIATATTEGVRKVLERLAVEQRCSGA